MLCMLLLKLYDAFAAPQQIENCRRNLKPLQEKQIKERRKL